MVDASELSISDMGTMNNAMGGGMGGPMEREDISAQPQGEEVPSGGQPFDLPVGEDSASLPMDGNVPERPQANTAAESGQDPMKLEMKGEKSERFKPRIWSPAGSQCRSAPGRPDSCVEISKAGLISPAAE